MNSNRSKSGRKEILNQKEITPASPLYVVDAVAKIQPPHLKVRFTLKQRLLLTTLFAIGLLFCSTCYPSGPDILNVTATPHSLGKRWEMTKSAQLRSLAMLTSFLNSGRGIINRRLLNYYTNGLQIKGPKA
ncbi:MAG: hypothetical protein EXR74_09515 [Bdellovibrionales bacterium]|nr:hypothetical protein [Bdellovibrionales bacterium]